MRLLALLSSLLFLTGPSCGPLGATEPCSPYSWFAKRDRPSAEWAGMAKWIAVGKVIAREERLEPYPNCYMKDRSQCAMLDDSILTVKVTRWEKGARRGVKRLKLSADYCAPPPPKTTGETLRFYGGAEGSYLYFEDLAHKGPSGS